MQTSKHFARRFMSSMAKPSSKFEGVVRLLPMPNLSPLMTSGKLLKWHAAEGAMISAYSLIADVQPDQLTAVLDERPIMEIELQEDMYIAKIFCAEGKEIKSGTPIAILCEIEEDIEHAKALLVDLTADINSNREGLPMALWQAYLQETAKK